MTVKWIEPRWTKRQQSLNPAAPVLATAEQSGDSCVLNILNKTKSATSSSDSKLNHQQQKKKWCENKRGSSWRPFHSAAQGLILTSIVSDKPQSGASFFPTWGFNAKNRRDELQLQQLTDLGRQMLSSTFSNVTVCCFSLFNLNKNGFSAAVLMKQNTCRHRFGYFSVLERKYSALIWRRETGISDNFLPLPIIRLCNNGSHCQPPHKNKNSL